MEGWNKGEREGRREKRGKEGEREGRREKREKDGEREGRREKRGKEGEERMSVSYVESSLCRGSNGCMEWRLSPVVLDVWIGSSREQLLNIVPTSTDSRNMEGSAAVVGGGIDHHYRCQEVINGILVGSTAPCDR